MPATSPDLLAFAREAGAQAVKLERLTRHGHHVQMQILPYLFHDRRHAARIVEALRRPPARRTHIQKISGVPVQSVEGISRNLQPEFMRDGRNMQQTRESG